MERVRMQQNHIAEIAGHLDEVVTLPDQLVEVEIVRQDAFRVLGEESGHHRHRVGGDEGSAALVVHVGPQHESEQTLLR